jgi:hypothetical protein
MTTQTATLTDFLLARIAEDEATIPSLDCRCGTDGVPEVASLPDCPDRIVAECEAKRRIVDLTQHGCGDDYERVQRALALPYADHSDYRPEWRP